MPVSDAVGPLQTVEKVVVRPVDSPKHYQNGVLSPRMEVRKRHGGVFQQAASLVILEHLSVLWPLKHFVCGIKTRLFIYVSKLCGVYEFRYTPEQPAPYSPNRREGVFSETRIQPSATLCVRTGANAVSTPDKHSIQHNM